MNSISSNILKKLCAMMLCVCMVLSISACTKNTKDIEEVDQICVSGSYAESWMYVYTDEDFINEMVDIFNGIEYEETEESVDMMTAGEVLSFTFSKGNDVQTKFIVDKNNFFTFEAGTQAYKITSDFDFDYVKGLVDEQREAFEKTLEATPDEV